MVQRIRSTLLVLLAAVGFVLLVACANVANLLLARSTARAHEFAVRSVLGAGQKRAVRQLLTESLLLAVAGAALGLILASLGTRTALAALPQALPRANDVRIDPRVLLFTVLISTASGVLFGLAPAFKSSRTDLNEILKEGGRGTIATRHRAQAVFVIAELALAVVLLIGAGLSLRSLAHLWSVDPGFDAHNVLTFDLAQPPSVVEETPDQIRAMLRRLPDLVAQIPGVQAASLTDGAEPMSNDDDEAFSIEGRPKPPTTSEMPMTLLYIVSPDYLKVMGIPLLRGRFFTSQDNAKSRRVGVIDENFVRRYFPDQDPIGQHVLMEDSATEIVGVVGHVKQWGLDEDARGPIKIQLYVLAEQVPDAWLPAFTTGTGFVVRTQSSNYPTADAIRSAVQQLNSEQATYHFASMDQTISKSLAARRFAMTLLGVFAALATVLSSVGIYGVTSYLASQRTHEIGIRMAMGAGSKDILRMMLGAAGRMALIGVGIGLVTSFLLMRLMSSMVFGVSTHDPLTFCGVAVLLTLVALAACLVPAQRATRVDPVVVLIRIG